jgi:adenylate cyclase class IV
MTHPTYVVEWPQDLTAVDANLISQALMNLSTDLTEEMHWADVYDDVASRDLATHQAARCRSLARMFKTAAQPSH